MHTPPTLMMFSRPGAHCRWKHRLHEDVSINFHLHRGIAWTGGDALPDIRGPSTSMLVERPVVGPPSTTGSGGSDQPC